MERFHKTDLGEIYLGDALDLMVDIEDKSVNLIMTSPPFGLVRKKDYGNVDADQYLDWFRPFAKEFIRILKDNGSLVIDIGGAWIPGQPTRSLYHYELLIMLCREFDFHLAQEFFWWNPSKLPTPAEWVNIRRVRVKDAVNCVWWLSPTPW
ncbi:MAG: site-specific DNA-methyltransferase, partial [Gemmatimonadetes bacterium]|nr:site-specific DNA-methyltransferase [Gemmatimonadota bacterium]